MDKVIVPARPLEAVIASILRLALAEHHLQLRDPAIELVARFAVQLAAKLAMAEQKHGYSDDWMERGHADHFRAELRQHVTKGDPTDVAAFCAFLWHHGDTAATGESADAELARLRAHSALLKSTLWRMSSALGLFTPESPQVEGGEIVDMFFARTTVQPGHSHTASVEPCALQEVFDEVERATRKFPTWPDQGLHALSILGEEFGELNRAMLQMTYEPHKVTREDIHTEAIQTAAMALRLVMSLGRYQYDQSPQHSQKEPA